MKITLEVDMNNNQDVEVLINALYDLTRQIQKFKQEAD